MKLHSPYFISARLAPALQIGKATLSYCPGGFVLDLPDGSSYIERNLRGPEGRVKGRNDTPETYLQDQFGAMLSFLSACAESRAYGMRQYGDALKGENSDLFPEFIGQWAEENNNEIDMLRWEIEERRDLIEA